MEGKQSRKIYLNPHQIEYIETEGERSTVTLLSGKKYAVLEKAPELIERIVAYRKSIGISVSE